MRRSLLSVALLAAIGMLLLVLWRNAGSDVDSLEDIMHRHGLTAAEIAYGHSGEQPRVRTVNAKVDMVRPLYSLAKPITAAAALRCAFSISTRRSKARRFGSCFSIVAVGTEPWQAIR